MQTAFEIYLSPPDVPQEALQHLTEAFNSGWIAPVGPHLSQFEIDFSKLLGGGFAHAVQSGSAAIQLMYRLLDVKANEVVIGPDLTYIATYSPLLEMQAEPWLVDVLPDTYQMDPTLAEKAILEAKKQGRKVAALHVVHFIGMPCDMEAFSTLARKYDIPLLEDSAESLGSLYKEKAIHPDTRMAAFSFNGNKILTTSGGGMLYCKDKKMCDKAQLLSRHGNEELGGYYHTQLGYNFRMSNLLAALGLAQLPKLEAFVQKRRAIFKRYYEALKAHVRFQKETDQARSNRWLTAIQFEEDRPDFASFMKDRGIEVRRIWRPMHLQPILKQAPFFGNGTAEHLFKTVWCLPSGSGLSEKDQQTVIDGVVQFLR